MCSVPSSSPPRAPLFTSHSCLRTCALFVDHVGGVAWRGVAWFCVVWCGVEVWFDFVWFGLVWGEVAFPSLPPPLPLPTHTPNHPPALSLFRLTGGASSFGREVVALPFYLFGWEPFPTCFGGSAFSASLFWVVLSPPPPLLGWCCSIPPSSCGWWWFPPPPPPPPLGGAFPSLSEKQRNERASPPKKDEERETITTRKKERAEGSTQAEEGGRNHHLNGGGRKAPPRGGRERAAPAQRWVVVHFPSFSLGWCCCFPPLLGCGAFLPFSPFGWWHSPPAFICMVLLSLLLEGCRMCCSTWFGH